MLKALPALAALAVAAALVVPTVSQAAEPRSVRVTYADLNLGTGFGQAKLQRRIHFAAAQGCEIADPMDLKFVRAVGECRTGAVAAAQPAYAAAIARARHGTVEVLDTAALIITVQ